LETASAWALKRLPLLVIAFVGSLEIGNSLRLGFRPQRLLGFVVPPSGGSLEIGNMRTETCFGSTITSRQVPPSGGSLEIGNVVDCACRPQTVQVPPSGGSLEIGNRRRNPSQFHCHSRSPFGGIPRNWKLILSYQVRILDQVGVPPSGGSLEIGNWGGT